MPLHERDTVRQQLEDCVFVGRDLTRPVPKYRFPRDETESREALQVVSDELLLDGVPGDHVHEVQFPFRRDAILEITGVGKVVAGF